MLSRFKRFRKSKRRYSGSDLAQSLVESLETRSLLSNVTLDLSASQDGTLYEDPNGAKANGAGSHFFAGPGTKASRRGLIQFDIAGAIPEGSIITDVTLTLHNSGGISNNRNVFLHPVTTPWGTGSSNASGGEYSGTSARPGDATWLHAFHSPKTWENPGGDFDGTSAVTRVAGKGFYEWSDQRMIEDVQNWLDDPDANNGWLIRSNENAKSVKRFDSSEHNNAERRPVLTITFEQPVALGLIEGRKWHDKNINGLHDPDEPWLNDVVIEIRDTLTGEVLESVTTQDVDINGDGLIDPESERGHYAFEVPAGTYTIREIPPENWRQSYLGYASDYGRKQRESASGAMVLSNGFLHFDFDVDAPRVPLRLAFYKPGEDGGLVPLTNPVGQSSAPLNRIVGRVELTPEEIGLLLNGVLTSGLLNHRAVLKAHGPVTPSGAHQVTLSDAEVVTERNFANYRLPDSPGNGPEETEERGGAGGDNGAAMRAAVADAADHGIHFGFGDEGQINILIAPQDLANIGVDETEEEPAQRDPVKALSLLSYIAKRNELVADAVDELFAGLDPLDILG